MHNTSFPASSSGHVYPAQSDASAALRADVAAHAEAERQRLGLSVGDARAAVQRALESASFSVVDRAKLYATITDRLEVQAAIASHFDQACQYAERVRRRYCLATDDGEAAVAHAFTKLPLHIRNVGNVWGWIKTTVCNFLVSRVRHASCTDEREHELRSVVRAAEDRRRSFYSPLDRAVAAEQSTILAELADAYLALRPAAVRVATVTALRTGTYNAAALAKRFGKKVSWISTLKGQFVDFARAHAPSGLVMFDNHVFEGGYSDCD